MRGKKEDSEIEKGRIKERDVGLGLVTGNGRLLGRRLLWRDNVPPQDLVAGETNIARPVTCSVMMQIHASNSTLNY